MRNYYYRIILLFLITVIIFILILPGIIFADYSVIYGNLAAENLEQLNLLAENKIDNQVNLEIFDRGFLPIIITSVIVIGILIFAMWQTIRSKKQF